MAMDPFEEFVHEGIRQCERRGYHPTTFKEMRGRLGTLQAMEQRVRSGELQSGFVRLKK